MNPVELFKLFGLWRKAKAVETEKVNMSVKLPQIAHLAITLTGVIGVPELAHKWLSAPAHLTVYVTLVAASALLHALSPSIFGGPSADAANQSGFSPKELSKLGMIVMALFLFGGMARAQTASTPPLPAPAPSNIYALGPSFNQSATPEIAGTALYAHRLTNGTYAFTAVDALPASVKPFTVTTNIGIGVAQKVATVGKVNIYAPTAAGISFSGQNTGWEWNAGALAAIRVHGQYYVMPEVRLVKASIGGSGYQPIVGVLFAWGQ